MGKMIIHKFYLLVLSIKRLYELIPERERERESTFNKSKIKVDGINN